MDRARKNEPRVNKILYEAELRFRKEMHEKKLRAVKSSVDTSAPKNFGVARRNLKKEMILEEKYSNIEHQNRLLLSRMSDIMTRPVGGGAAAGAGGVDNVCEAWEYGRSMNTRNRRSEMERINAANERDLRKIRSVEPMYNHLEWDQHAKDAEKLALQLTEFQKLPIGAERRRSPTRGGGTSPRMGASGQQQQQGGDMMSMSHLGGSQQHHPGGLEGGGSGWARGTPGGGGDMYGSQLSHGGLFNSQQGQQQQQQMSASYQQGGSQYGVFPGGMGLNPSSSFIGGGGLTASRSGIQPPTPSGGVGNPSSYSLPGLSDALGGGGGGSRGESRSGLATPGGTSLGTLGPSAAALLAKYGYSSVLNVGGGGGGGGSGQPPYSGSAVPTGLGPATGDYPRVGSYPRQ